MYKKNKLEKTTLIVNAGYEGEPIEIKVQKILNSKEPIKDGAPLIYTERKDGVLPSYNIRTDKWEVAVEAMGAVTKAKIAKRDGFGKVIPMEGDKDKNVGENPESIVQP